MTFTITGIGASTGLTIGQAFWWNKTLTVEESGIDTPQEEVKRLDYAILSTQQQISTLRNLAVERMGEEEAAIFDAHLSFLEDPSFTGEMKQRIRSELKNAEAICNAVIKELCTLFHSLDDEYMRARAEDIQDVGNRLLKNLINDKQCVTHSSLPPDVILIATDLTPSDTVQFSKEIRGIITAKGSRTSHAAIIARTLGIPAVFGIQQTAAKICNGDRVCLDGDSGIISINPTPLEEQEFLARLKQNDIDNQHSLREAIQETYTADGQRIHIFATIGHPRDIEPALSNHAEGIGLFRTEFLFLERQQWPTEEEQFELYRTVLQAFSPKPVILRTLDIGGDKQISYAKLPVEENPYLGCRGIRYCLENTEIFKTQLRSLLRASIYGNSWILLPMISNVDQVQKTKKILNQCKTELSQRDVPYTNIKIGAMIEVPAAALIADTLAKEVDFFSIGTNDLTQYTLAADRGNEQIVYLYDETHPAIMRLIQMVCDAAQAQNIPVGVCGELGSNRQVTEQLLKMGIQELSVTPTIIPKMKKAVRNIFINQAQTLSK